MNLITLLSPYAIALILTLIIEGTLCFIFLKSKAWLKFTCLVNLFTNPLVNFLYAWIYAALANTSRSGKADFILLILELGVWLSEAYLFYQLGKTPAATEVKQQKTLSTIYKALLFSFTLNAASYGTGLLLQL